VEGVYDFAEALGDGRRDHLRLIDLADIGPAARPIRRVICEAVEILAARSMRWANRALPSGGRQALTAVQVALLTIHDMCKAGDRGITITDARVREKHGDKSGSFVSP